MKPVFEKPFLQFSWKRPEVLKAVFISVAVAAFTYLFILQVPGVISRRFLLMSCITGVVIGILYAYLYQHSKHRFNFSLKTIWTSALIFLSGCILLFDLPINHLITPKINIEVRIPNEISGGKEIFLSGISTGIGDANINNAEFINAKIESDGIRFLPDEKMGSNMVWVGYIWEKVQLRFHSKSAGVPIYLAINGKIEKIFSREGDFSAYLPMPHFKIYRTISLITVASSLLFFYIAVMFVFTGFLDALLDYFSTKKTSPKNTTFQKLIKLTLIVIAILVCTAIVKNGFLYKYPGGSAGLYTLMAESLRDNHFIPPENVPYYAGGVVPFAYPFIGFYVAGFVSKLSGLSLLDYTKIFPPIFLIAAFFLHYKLSTCLTRNKTLALAGTLLTASSINLFNLHAYSGGMVRGLALLLMIIAMYFIKLKRQEIAQVKNQIIIAVALAACFMTHLVYGLVGAIYISVSLLLEGVEEKLWSRLTYLFRVGILTILLSAPWWVMVINRYGLNTLLNSVNTHDTGGFFQLFFSGNFSVLQQYLRSQIQVAFPLYTVFLVVILTVNLQKQISPELLTWAIVLGFIGEAHRFTAIFSGWLAIQMIENVLRNAPFSDIDNDNNPLINLLILAMLPMLALGVQNYHRFVDGFLPEITDELIETARWLKENTPTNARYLMIDQSNANPEWFPYLSTRTAVIGPWGAEWTGDFEDRNGIHHSFFLCQYERSIDCVMRTINQVCKEGCDYFIIAQENDFLLPYFESETHYKNLYHNEGYSIYINQE